MRGPSRSPRCRGAAATRPRPDRRAVRSPPTSGWRRRARPACPRRRRRPAPRRSRGPPPSTRGRPQRRPAQPSRCRGTCRRLPGRARPRAYGVARDDPFGRRTRPSGGIRTGHGRSRRDGAGGAPPARRGVARRAGRRGDRARRAPRPDVERDHPPPVRGGTARRARRGARQRAVRRRADRDQGPRRRAGRRAAPDGRPRAAGDRLPSPGRLGRRAAAPRGGVHLDRADEHVGVGEHDHRRAARVRPDPQPVEHRPLDRRLVGRFRGSGGGGDRRGRARR